MKYKFVLKVMLLASVGLLMFPFSAGVSASTVENLVDFNSVTDLTDLLNDDGTPVFTNLADSGINNTGSVNVPIPSNDIWTTKQGYSVTGNAGDVYTFSAYFLVAVNSGYGNLGFTTVDANTADSYGQPATGLGANFHGGGGAFVNNGTQTILSWPPDLVLGNWYWMTFEVTAQGSNTYDLKLQIWNTDSSGVIGTMKTEKTLNGVVNTDMGSASTIHAFFSAAGSRMEKIDDFKVELVGATFVEEDEPVVVAGTLGSPDDTSITYGGDVTDDQGYAVTAKGTCWSTSPNPTTADDCTDDGSGLGAFTSNVTGLTPGTTYYIRTYATNSEGTSYGEQETFTTTGTAPKNDSDGVDDTIESKAPNSGDANDDGTADNEQDKVSSLVSPVSEKYVVLEASTCTANSGVSLSEEKSDAAADEEFEYPAGLLSFTLTGCAVGATETITQYYFGDFDLDNLVLRKYDDSSDTYTTIENATITEVTVGGESAIKVSYEVTDGGALDADGLANGEIVDPVGPGVGVLAASGVPVLLQSAIGLSVVIVALVSAAQVRRAEN